MRNNYEKFLEKWQSAYFYYYILLKTNRLEISVFTVITITLIFGVRINIFIYNLKHLAKMIFIIINIGLM